MTRLFHISDLHFGLEDQAALDWFRECVRRVDILRMGHVKIRPAPGFLFARQRRRWLEPRGRAADRVLRTLGR